MSKLPNAIRRLQRKVETLEQQRDDLLAACRSVDDDLSGRYPLTKGYVRNETYQKVLNAIKKAGEQ